MDPCPIHPSIETNGSLQKNNMAILFKTYTGNNQKYSGEMTDNFVRKFMFVLERRKNAKILDEDRKSVFPILPMKYAFQFNFDLIKLKDMSGEAESPLKSRFLTPERTRAPL